MMDGPYGVDYRRLLKKYMEYVNDWEGWFFLPRGDDDTFARGEYYVLADIADEIIAKLEPTPIERVQSCGPSPEYGGLHLRRFGDWFRFNLHLGNSIPYSVTPAVIPTLGCNKSNMPDMTRPPSPWLWAFWP